MGDDPAQTDRIRTLHEQCVAAGEAEFLQRGDRFARVFAMGVGDAVAKRLLRGFPQLAEPLTAAQVDYAVLVGEEMLALARELGKAAQKPLGNGIAYAHCENPGEAIAALEEFGLAGGDAVLVKGSNSVGLGRVVAHFAAREG